MAKLDGECSFCSLLSIGGCTSQEGVKSKQEQGGLREVIRGNQVLQDRLMERLSGSSGLISTSDKVSLDKTPD